MLMNSEALTTHTKQSLENSIKKPWTMSLPKESKCLNSTNLRYVPSRHYWCITQNKRPKNPNMIGSEAPFLMKLLRTKSGYVISVTWLSRCTDEDRARWLSALREVSKWSRSFCIFRNRTGRRSIFCLFTTCTIIRIRCIFLRKRQRRLTRLDSSRQRRNKEGCQISVLRGTRSAMRWG